MPRPNDSRVPAEDYGRQVKGWAKEAIEESESFLRSQPGYDKIEDTVDAIMGEDYGTPTPAGLPDVRLNHLGKVALDLASALTDLKPFWEYKTYNKRFEPQQVMLGKRSTSWWTNRHIDLKWLFVVQYALASGSGCGQIIYDQDTRDQDIIPEDSRDVLPIRPNDFLSLQNALGVCLRRERTVNYLRRLYPEKAAKIHADRDGSMKRVSSQTRAGRLMSALGVKSGFMENLMSSLAGRPQARPLGLPVADLHTIYVRDDSLNLTGHDVAMGTEGTNWSYIVKPGEPLYPFKRCIVIVNSCDEPLYDGPSIYWHGMFPVVKLTLDPWPWTWLGKAPLKDLLTLQRELDSNMRIVAQHNKRVGQPGISADKNAVPRAVMNAIDTRRAGLKIRHNPIAGRGVELLNEPPLDQSIPMTIEFLIRQMRELTGAGELSQLMKLGQIPAAETIEKLLEAMSPAVRLRSRVMEVMMREMAMMVASNFMQFDTLAQRIALLGPSGITFEDFDYDPGTLIPDFVDDDDRASGTVRPRHERARNFLRYFTYHIAPGSLLSASQVTRKLMMVMLSRAGLIDHWTLLETLDIPNVGEPPDGANTITERMAAERSMGLGMQVSAVGRKASGQEMPRMKISESGD